MSDAGNDDDDENDNDFDRRTHHAMRNFAFEC